MKQALRWPALIVILCTILVSAALFSLLPLIHRGSIPAAHAASPPTITPASSIIHGVHDVQITGSGFEANEVVIIYLDTISGYNMLGSIPCDGQGNCSGKIWINPYITAGSHTLIGQGNVSMLEAEAPVTIIAGIGVSPYWAGPDTPIQVTGGAFALNETVSVYWGTPKTGIFEGTVTSDSYSGNFTFTFTPPTGLPGGQYLITVKRTNETPPVVSAWFTLKLSHLYVLTPGFHAGHHLIVKVSGFEGSEEVSLSWSANGGQTLTTFSTNYTGSGAGSVIPPVAPQGTYTLTATGLSSGLTATGTVSVGPGIILNEQIAGLGQTISVTGGGFSPDETINVYFQHPSYGVVTAISDSGGNFTASLTLPDTLNPKQNYHVYAISTSNGEKAIAPLSFYIPAASLLDQYTGYGAANKVYGENFVPGETVKIIWDYHQPGQLLLATVTADSTGSFVLPITVPSDPNLNTVTMTTIGLESRIINTSQVYEGANILTQPTSGPDGSIVDVLGGGFDAGETVSVSFLGQVVATATTDRTGAFATSFVVPQATGPGAYFVTAIGETSQLKAETYFTVVPAVTLNPNTGPSGTTIIVTGNSFRPTETVSIWWYDPHTNSNYLLTKVTTTAQGTFSTKVQAEQHLINGYVYYVQAVDVWGQGQAPFTAQ